MIPACSSTRLLCSDVVALVCSRHTSILNVLCLVLFCFLLHVYLCCFLLTVLGCWVLQAVPDIYSQIKPLIKALKVDLVSVFCVNRENMEMSNSHLSVYLKDVDFGPNNVDNLPSFSYAAFTDTFTVYQLFNSFIICLFFQCFKKIPWVSQSASWTFIRTSRRQNDNQAHHKTRLRRR